MTLTIYGSYRSRTRRVLWAAEELGIAFEQEPLGAQDPALKQAPYRAINPLGRIPAIRDGELALSESLAINLYLAKQHRQKSLYPETPEGEAKAWQWTLFAASDLDPWVVLYMGHRHNLPEDQRQPALAVLARQRIEIALGFLETRLGTSPFLIGQEFTIADLNVSAVLQPLTFVAFDLSAFAKTAAWLHANLARPAALAARERP
jgi:glutathione S-transferase